MPSIEAPTPSWNTSTRNPSADAACLDRKGLDIAFLVHLRNGVARRASLREKLHVGRNLPGRAKEGAARTRPAVPGHDRGREPGQSPDEAAVAPRHQAQRQIARQQQRMRQAVGERRLDQGLTLLAADHGRRDGVHGLLLGSDPSERAKVVAQLATLLLQAAGVQAAGSNDDEL
jgi:hypothetical protein